MIPKCGNRRVWHWAHHGERHCDPWWEETAWHIAWKNRFLPEWREIVHTAPDGERHIADVKLPDERVLEFQHSPIADAERQSREAFYRTLVWVVDGLRRKRDLKSFTRTLHATRDPFIFSGFEDECALLRDWVGRSVDVVFDFGERDEDIEEFNKPVLWHLFPDRYRRVFLAPIHVDTFISMLQTGEPLPRISPEPPRSLLMAQRSSGNRSPVEGFQQYLQRMKRRRPRL